jgi:hypothetical protein
VIAGPFSLSASDLIGMRGGSASGSVQPGQSVELTISLEAAGDIFGTVFAPDGATPAPNISVRLTPLNRVVTTAADGKFRFELVPVRFSPFTLEASDASGAIRAVAENIVLPTQDAEVQRDLLLDGLGLVFGDVFTPAGALASGASVTINSQALGFPHFQATTNEFGRYVVRSVPVGLFSVSASVRKFGQGGEGNGEVKFDGDEARADVHMLDNQVPRDTVPVGNLFDVNNFIFQLQNTGSVQDGQQSVYAGNSSANRGGMRLDFLQGDTLFTVDATHPLTARVASETGDFTGEPVAIKDIVFSQLGLIGGTVMRPNGTVVSGAEVQISGSNLLQTVKTATALDGSYLVGGIPPGNYTVSAQLKNPNGTGLAGSTSGVVTAGAKSTINVPSDPAGGVESKEPC